MSETTAHQYRIGRVVFPRLFTLSHALIGAAYLAGYVLLDWISFIYPFAHYNITPWNPPPGLSFVLVLLCGQRMMPYLFLAPLLADLITRQLPFPWTLELATTAIIGVGYSLALIFLLRPKTRFNPALPSLRDLFLLLATAAVSAALVAIAFVAALTVAGLLSVEDFFQASLQYWVGDLIGIVVITPFGLMLSTREPLVKASVETGAQFAAILIALLLVFGLSQEQELQLFYIVFLPIVWLAVRSGLKGVTAGILVTQLGLIVGVLMLSKTTVDVMAFQLLMLVLAVTGLVAGAIVTERRRAEFLLRRHQDSFALSARLQSVGELAAAVAHEINQPLMAAGTYSRLVRDALHRERNSDPSIVQIADKVAAQLERASEVMRRLRALVRLDKSDRVLVMAGRIVNEALDLCQEELNCNGISCRTILEDNLPAVMVDVLQIEQVVLNVVRNAIEAMNETAPAGRMITIEAKQVKSGDVELSVRDTGPGFADGQMTAEFLPFATTKAQGIGIGLSLSRTIIEAHGGQLTAGGDARGAVVRFTLPAATKPYD
jgi:two-component system sensor kinase FixL